MIIQVIILNCDVRIRGICNAMDEDTGKGDFE